MATKKPTDVTGQAHAELQKKQLEDQAQAAANAQAAKLAAETAFDTDVIDATKPAQETVVVDEVIAVAPAKEKTVIIRVVEDVDSMTIGAGNHYSFRAGQKYEVAQFVADILREKGYLSNVL